MDLKSKMSLDIGNVTKNLSKVASDTKNLAKQLSTSMSSAAQGVKQLNSELTDTAKMEGVGKFKAFGKMMITSIGGSARETMSKVKEAFVSMPRYIGAFKTSAQLGMMAAAKSIHEYSFSVGDAVAKTKLFASTIKGKVISAVLGVTGLFRSMTTSAIRPLADGLTNISNKFAKLSATMKGVLYTGNKTVQELLENTKKTGVQFKDVGRIVQGIMISKVFYSGLNMIRRTTDAVFEFAKGLEYSKMVYSNMFKDADLSNEYIDVLQDFAAKTRYSFVELNEASQQLVAYGFESKNLMYVLKGVSAAASISGDPQKMEAISRALGQIGTKGRLMGEELRQLAEAGVPAYEILQEKLGLTYEQMRNLGKEAIPANEAINALVDGMNERFGGLLDQTNTTLTGMISNIGDMALQIASDMLSPVYEGFKKFVSFFAKGLSSIYEIYKQSGIGGVFESLVPKGLQEGFRTHIANAITNINSIAKIIKSIFAIIKSVMPTLLTWLNMLNTALSFVLNVLANVLDSVTSNAESLATLSKVLLIATAAWIAYKTAALAAASTKVLIKIVDGITKATATLSNSLTILAQHPLLLIATILTGVLLVNSAAFDKVRESINKLLSSSTGVDRNKLLQPKEMDKSTSSVDKFNEKLDGTSDSIKDLAKNAKKASKSLLSFDEVFSISPDEGTDDGILTEWEEFLAGIGAFDPADILKDINLKDFADPFVDSLIAEFGDAVKDLGKKLGDKLKEVGIGPVLAGVIAGIALGNPWVGLVATLVAYFWDELKDGLIAASPNPEEWSVDINAAMDNLGAGLLASLTLKALKFPFKLTLIPTVVFGALALMDLLTAWVEDKLGLSKSDEKDKMTYKLSAMEVVFGTVNFSWPKIDMSGFFGEKGILGEAANLGVAGIVGYIAMWFMTKLDDWTNDLATDPETEKWAVKLIGALGESLAGAVIGGTIATPFGGTLAGFIIGAIVGALPAAFDLSWQEIWDILTEQFKSVFDWAFSEELREKINECFKDALDWDSDKTLAENAFDFGVNIIKGILLGVANVKLLVLIRIAIRKFLRMLVETAKVVLHIHSPSEHPDIVGIGDNIMLGILEGMVAGVATMLGRIGEWKDDLVTKFGEWKDATVEKATEFKDGAEEKIGLFTTNTKEKFETWWSGSGGVKEKFTDFKDGTIETVADWWSGKGGMRDKFSDFKDKSLEKLKDWQEGKGGAGSIFTDFKDDTITKVETWWSGKGGMREKFEDFKTKSLEKLKEWQEGKEGAGSIFTDFKDDTLDKIETWYSGKNGMRDKFTDFADKTKETVETWWSGKGGVKEKFTTFSDNTKETIGGFTTDAETKFGTFKTNSLATISSWASEVAKKVSSSLSSAWDSVNSLKDSAAAAVKSAKAKVEEGWNNVKEFVGGVGTNVVNYVAENGLKLPGHYNGGVFDKEHIAKFAEGGKREAIIPLENDNAMQPFVDAVSDGVYRSLAPMLSVLGGSNSNQAPNMYVGTLIADDRGLKELNRKMNLIKASEEARTGGLANA